MTVLDDLERLAEDLRLGDVIVPDDGVRTAGQLIDGTAHPRIHTIDGVRQAARGAARERRNPIDGDDALAPPWVLRWNDGRKLGRGRQDRTANGDGRAASRWRGRTRRRRR